MSMINGQVAWQRLVTMVKYWASGMWLWAGNGSTETFHNKTK